MSYGRKSFPIACSQTFPVSLNNSKRDFLAFQRIERDCAVLTCWPWIINLNLNAH